MHETMSIVRAQWYMKPQTSRSVRRTHIRIQKQVCGSAISTAVVAITHINARTRFLVTSSAITLSVTHEAKTLLHTVTKPRIPDWVATRFASSIAGIHSWGPLNLANVKSIPETRILGAFEPHVRPPSKRKLPWYLPPLRLNRNFDR